MCREYRQALKVEAHSAPPQQKHVWLSQDEPRTFFCDGLQEPLYGFCLALKFGTLCFFVNFHVFPTPTPKPESQALSAMPSSPRSCKAQIALSPWSVKLELLSIGRHPRGLGFSGLWGPCSIQSQLKIIFRG